MELIGMLIELLLYGMAAGADSPKIPLAARLMLISIIMAIPIVPIAIIGFVVRSSAGLGVSAVCWGLAFGLFCLLLFLWRKMIRADKKYKLEKKLLKEESENQENN